MLYFYSGTDRAKALEALNAHVEKFAKKNVLVTRISDANSLADLASSMQGGGMFEQKRIVVLNGVLGNEEMRQIFTDALPTLKDSNDTFFIFEEKLDAATRKLIEKYAEDSKRFDAASKRKDGTIFALANALKRGDKKALWVAYQRELAADSAPEAIHGVLFWGAKDMLLKTRDARARKLIATLAELPHGARRKGVELEYALERFLLSGA